MRPQDQLFGQYLPGRSVIHRLPVGLKYALLFAGTLPSLLLREWWLAAALVAVAVVLLLATRLPVRLTLRLGTGLLVLVAFLVGYHVLFGEGLATGVMISANLVGCIYLSRMLTFTTPAPVLVDALVGATRPLGRLGFPSERFGLAVALMLRSLPYLVGLFDEVRNSARARGLERNWFAMVTPGVVGAVAYAQRTGDALVARGLGDD
ncbi:hypothetical protein GCM10027030_25670 [Luteococcus sediminum]